MDTQNKKFNPVWILAVVVLGFFALMMLNRSTSSNKASNDTAQQPGSTVGQMPVNTQEPTQATDSGSMSGATEPSTDANTKVFTITGSNYSFDIKEIRVKKGDTVKIIFKNQEGFHDWRIDAFNATTKVIQTGETDTATFVADKAGTFEYYCSVGQHRAMGMKGNLIVDE